LDKKTDIWSFGCIFYEILTGKKVFEGETASDSIAAVLEREPDWQELPDSTPVRVHNLLRRCLRKDANQRLHDIADARIEIEEIQSKTPEALQPPSEITEKKPPSRPWGNVWPYVLLVVLTAILTGTIVWLLMRSPGLAFPPNPTPVVVLMDSPIPERIYDPETRANRGTNADDLTDILRDLPIVIHKETTSSTWHREDQVLKQNPDLILVHRSCFYDDTNLSDKDFRLSLYTLAESKLTAFLGYIALGNPMTKFLVYSRGFTDNTDPDLWKTDVEKRFPSLEGRIIVWPVPGLRENATFRDPITSKQVKRMVISILNLEPAREESVPATPADTGAMNSIAVLPFVNMSPEEGQEYFCDGLTEQLITALSNIKELKVVARTSVFSFKGKEMDVRDIGNQLNVETVLEGSVRKSGDTLRVTAQLIKVEDGYYLWSEQFDRKMDDVFAIQDEVTLAIVDKLKLDLLSDERPKIVKRYTENIDAYNLYLMGRYYWNRRTGEGLRKGLVLFQQAIEKDPTFALAYAGAADSYNLLGYYYHMPSKEALPKAKTAAERALEIDESLAEAHTSLAWVSMFYDWDWTAAEKEYKRAIELNPNYATAHHWYSFYLMIMGRRDESIDEARLSVALDPLSLQINNHMASMLHLAGQYTQAVEEFKRIIEMNPSYVLAHNELGHTYVELKMYDKALVEYQKVTELLGTRTPSIIADLGYLYAVTGRTNEAKKMLEELQGLSEKMYVSPWGFAVIHLGLGQIDQAYEWLEKAYKERDHSMIVFKIVSYFEEDL
jgi:serine/threonine-protein kinase